MNTTRSRPVYLQRPGIICALGDDAATVARTLFAAGGSGVVEAWRQIPQPAHPRALPEAFLAGLPIPAGWPAVAGRTAHLLLAAARQIDDAVHRAIAEHGAHRVGLVLDTSTGGIHHGGQALQAQRANGRFPPGYDYRDQMLGVPAELLARRWQLTGPCQTVATACTSGGVALMSARRLLQLGVCDAVVCGGADGLAAMPLQGFAALSATSAVACNPFSRNRNGINIGEGAALFVMSREPGPVALLGAAANADAWHMAAPRPDGQGAITLMRAALRDAGLAAGDIDYLNLHGTATLQNDAMESRAVEAVFPQGVPCSSTKPLTGHTLGAAAAIEAALLWLTLVDNPQARLPPHLWDGEQDPDNPVIELVGMASDRPGRPARSGGARRLMSNSFAFGGSNVSLILGDGP